MGASSDNLDTIAALHAKRLLPSRGAIADLGCTQLRGATGEDVLRFLRHFGPIEAAEAERLARHNTFLGEHLTAAGFRYQSFDIIEAPMCEHFDLNGDSVPERHRNAFDLVLNFGTTEHVLNQLNAMKAMHDMAKPGGLFYSLFVRGGHMDHGLLHYSDRFVDLLCAANRYDTVWRDDQNKSGGECTWIVLRKVVAAPFAAPLDVEEESDGAAAAAHGPFREAARHGPFGALRRRLRPRTRLKALWEALRP